MSRWILALALVALGSCRQAESQEQPATPAAASAEQARPVALGFHVALEPVELTGIEVYDGDTFDAGLERFRPDGIDTPELGDKAHCPLEQQRAEAARDLAISVFRGAQRVVATPTERRRDRYGRVVARIVVDGRDYNEIMLERDFARPYIRPPGWNWCATPIVECAANSDACGRASGRRRQPAQ
jgi:endonuclease YncB( thermonuclease family)